MVGLSRLNLGLGLGSSGSGGGGASAMTFVQPSSLIMNFDPATLTGTDGTGQASWTDSKGGMVASVTGGGQPTLKTNAINGKPALRCAGNQWMDLGRPTALINAIAGDYTIMLVCTNLVAGANVAAGLFGQGRAADGFNLWFMLNTTNMGIFGNTQYRANPLATTDLYVMFYSGRRNTLTAGLTSAFPRTLAGVNGTGFFENSSAPSTADAGNFGIGTARLNDTTSGNTYSFKGDILGIYGWNTNLAYVDIIRQTRLVHTFYGKPMPWAGVSNRFWIADGDSITLGIGGGYGAAQNYPSIAATSMSKTFGQWSKHGRNGATAVNLAEDYGFQYTGISGADALGIPCLFTFLAYTNGKGTSIPYTGTDAYGVAAKTINPTCMTVMMNSVAIGGTSGDQSGLGGPTSATGTHRQGYAAAYLAAHPNWDIVVDTASDSLIGVVGANPYSGAKPVSWFDDLHPTPTGYGTMSGLIVPAISPYL